MRPEGSPFVAGLAAILRGIPGNASPDAIAWQMESTALDIESSGWDPYSGYGLIQMDAATQVALPQPAPPGAEPKFPSAPHSGQGLPSPTFSLTPFYTDTPTPETEGTVSFTPTHSPTPTGEPEVVAPEANSPRETPRSGRGSNELAHPLYGADSDSPGNRSVLGLYTFAQEGQSPEHKVGMKEISNNQSYSVSKG